MGIQLSVKNGIRILLLIPLSLVFLHCGGSKSNRNNNDDDRFYDRDVLSNRRKLMIKELERAQKNVKALSTTKSLFCDLRKKLRKKGNSIIEIWTKDLSPLLVRSELERTRSQIRTGTLTRRFRRNDYYRSGSNFSRRDRFRGTYRNSRNRLDLGLFNNLSTASNKSYLVVDSESDYAVIRIHRDTSSNKLNMVAFPLYSETPDWPLAGVNLNRVLKRLRRKCKDSKPEAGSKDAKAVAEIDKKDDEFDEETEDDEEYDEETEFGDDVMFEVIELIEAADID